MVHVVFLIYGHDFMGENSWDAESNTEPPSNWHTDIF